jgi:stearoyl-CoA desaturase (delta-9 desaturase)
MKSGTSKDLGFYSAILATWIGAFWALPLAFGPLGFAGSFFETNTILKMAAVYILMAHLTISAMSIAFHRGQTHHSVKLNPVVDMIMQSFLWGVTSMSKLDWVSVHVYHHTHSDTDKDPHSPKQKGLLRVFFLGAMDYSRAKSWPEVLQIRKRIPANAFERFISNHLFTGPTLLTALLMIIFGAKYGTILGLLNFSISPLFAVGGVNALAHWTGYQNYESKDESRNLGFLFFLNWIICGELDHNNHHKYPKSPSFAHRWFEFDIGWVYVRMLKVAGLASITGKVPDYGTVKPRKAAKPEKMETYDSPVALVS